MNIHSFHHVPFEGLAAITDWIEKHGHQVTSTHWYEDDTLPDIHTIDWLMVMGGPMSTGDEHLYPWLVAEKQYIEQAIAHEKVVLGICLGAQLVAEVLGARVSPNRYKEIGWFPLTLTEDGQRSPLFRFLPQQVPVFHWHGDTFDLPEGATHIAMSEACHNQAFVYGSRVVGLQFHLEVTTASIAALIQHCGDELLPGPYIQHPDEMLGRTDDVAIVNSAMVEVLSRLQRG